MAQQFDYPKTETQLREIQDALYQHSKEVYEAGGRPAFKGLLEIMSAESTIITAIHNIKGNHGSETPGVDSKTMRKDYLQKPFPWVVADIQRAFKHFERTRMYEDSAGTYIRSTILCTFLWIPPHARCGYGLRTS